VVAQTIWRGEESVPARAGGGHLRREEEEKTGA
jgi:hypothetical protein